MAGRLDGFTGTNEQYILYLEKELLVARQTPNTECPRASKKRRTCDDPSWMKCAKQLIDQTPVSQSWTSSLKESGIHELLKNGDAVSCLLNATFESQLSARTATGEVGVVDETDDEPTASLRMYARTTSMRLSSASTALALANFQKFVVISACAVLAQGDTPIAKVYDIIRICVGNKSTDQYCKRTMASAKYLNQLIDTLNIHDWGQRAAELILLWNRAPSYYYSLSCSKEGSLEYLKSRLCLKDFTVTPVDSSGWTPIFMPSLVYHILGKRKSIEHVSHVLGYRKAHLLATRGHPWHARRDHVEISRTGD